LVQCLILDLPGGRGYRAKVTLANHAGEKGYRRKALGEKGLRRTRALEPPIPRLELRAYYEALFAAHGPQQWWPGRTRFEVIVGAILTQNTTWTSVERAIRKLRAKKLLSPIAFEHISEGQLAKLIRSSGYFRQKARKLKEFVRFLGETYGGSLTRMFRMPTNTLRQQLLGVHGIGPETADSILLYAGKHPVFVVDAYTRRILERHQLLHGSESYEEIRILFEQSLPSSAQLFNEYHALMVHTGKEYCRSKAALCTGCALRPFLPQPAEAKQ